MRFLELIDFNGYLNELKKLPETCCVAFVFNDLSTYSHDDHLSECVTSQEEFEILNGFRSVLQFVFSYNSEQAFIEEISMLKQKFKYIFVYSMAQDTNGIGRRCLVPLLCEHFGLYNIGADSYSSMLGGNKWLMQALLENNLENVKFPMTYTYRNKQDSKQIEYFYTHQIDFMIKPNSESASIGVKKIKVIETTIEDALSILDEYYHRFGELLLQEYIPGDEIEVPVIHSNGIHTTLGAIEIVFRSGVDFLDHATIANERYDFKNYEGLHRAQIISMASQSAQTLGFSAISRFDFRVNDTGYYLMDITPNPTISSKSSVYELCKSTFKGDEDSAYKMLILATILKYGLFKPAFNPTE